MLALDISDLKKTYKGGIKAINNLSLKIEDGDFFALLGPNGAGKSTLISIISSLAKKDSGVIKVFGNDIIKDKSKIKMLIGIVPQEFNFSPFETPMDILINQGGYYGVPRSISFENAEKYLKVLDLWKKKDTQARFLSGGMKRRLMIARAMMHDPKILILDEPTAGVDIEVRYQIWKFLEKINKQEGKTIVLTTHYLEEAEHLCKNLAIIHNGQIVKNCSMDEVLESSNQINYTAEIEPSKIKSVNIKGAKIKFQSDKNIHISITKSKISDVISGLTDKGIVITKLINQPNKLETLFLELTGKNT